MTDTPFVHGLVVLCFIVTLCALGYAEYVTWRLRREQWLNGILLRAFQKAARESLPK